MRNFFLLFIGIAVFFSCEKNDDAIVIDNDVIHPLGVGYTWEYIDSAFTEEGTLDYVDTSKLGITGKTTIQYEGEDVEVFYWSWYNDNDQEYRSNKWLMSNGSNGLYCYGGATSKDIYVIEKTMNLKYPANANDSWERIKYTYRTENDSTYFYRGDTVTSTCVATNEIFSTPLHQYTCYKYHYVIERSNYTDDVYLYQVPKIGYVGYIRKRDGVVMFKKVLSSYNLTYSSMSSSSKSSGEKREKDFYNMFE